MKGNFKKNLEEKSARMKPLNRILVFTLWTFIYAIILFFFAYSMARNNIFEAFVILKVSFSANPYSIIIPCLMIVGLLLVSKSIFKNTFVSNLVVTILVTVITIISYYKYKVLVQPFIPTDILLVKNANDIATFGITAPSINMIYSIVVLIAVLSLQFLIERKYNISYKIENWKKELYRIPLLIIGVVLIYFLCMDEERFSRFNLKSDLGDCYTYYGGNTTFLIHLGDLYTRVPKEYSQDKIEKIKNDYTDKNEIVNKEKVNVIFIMAEAFSDPTKIVDVNYSKDPLFDIRELLKNNNNCKMGSCITPVLGGGTSLPEFEALTGLSSYYISKQIYPYTSYIISDMNSIVREYNKNGYETLGLHTNTETFYNRGDVYNFLGFKETIFAEDIENPIYKGGVISDEEFRNQIINKFQNTRNTNKFIFGVTMQNHMPYHKKTYDNYDIKVTSNKYAETDIKSLSNYVQGVYDSNKMYIDLVNYLKKYNEPTILVMFGDHLPSLSQYKFYKDSKYDIIDMHETPYVIWSNYETDFSNMSKLITPASLGLTLLNLSGNTLPWYLRLFSDIYQEYPIFNNLFVINRESKLVKEEDLKDLDLIRSGDILQYELMIKKKYIK